MMMMMMVMMKYGYLVIAYYDVMFMNVFYTIVHNITHDYMMIIMMLMI